MAPPRTPAAVKADRPEAEAFARLYPQLMPALKGKWLVMHGDGITHIDDDMDGAARYAYRHFEPGTFIVVQVTPEPDPFGRDDDE